jgi:hypothetical protein
MVYNVMFWYLYTLWKEVPGFEKDLKQQAQCLPLSDSIKFLPSKSPIAL